MVMLVVSLIVALFGVFSDATAQTSPTAAPLICDVRTFGAIADDERADTRAIQNAIDACARSGGQVILPRGRWLSGGLELKSDMTFTLSAGAVLTAIPDIALYAERQDPAVATDAAAPGDDAYRSYRAFLYAANARNLIVEGPGIIDGQGPKFWDENFYSLNIPRPTRPRPQQMMEFIDCGNVAVRDLTLREAPAYSVRFYRCEGVRAENITIRNDPRSPNTDGIQIRDTRNAVIRGADINTGDDAIVVKSYDRLVENLVVSDSILISDDSAIKFGTAGHVGVSNATFNNIIIRDSRYGIALFQMDGGAYTNTRFSNMTIATGGRATNHFAIYADIDRRRENSPLGRIDGLTFSNIDLTTAGTVLISGQPDAPIRNLTLSDVRVTVTDPAQAIAPTRRKPRGNAFVPPTGRTRDFANLESTVTIGHAANVAIRDLHVTHSDPNTARSALALQFAQHVRARGIWLRQANPTQRPLVLLEGGEDLDVQDAIGPTHSAPGTAPQTSQRR